MSELKKKLTKKIDISDLFILLINTNYIESIKNLDGNILTQIETARNLNKPFFMIIDKNMSKEEMEFLSNYFSEDNIIKIMEIDMRDRYATKEVAKEIKRLAVKLSTKTAKDLPIDDDVKLITQDSKNDIE